MGTAQISSKYQRFCFNTSSLVSQIAFMITIHSFEDTLLHSYMFKREKKIHGPSISKMLTVFRYIVANIVTLSRTCII